MGVQWRMIGLLGLLVGCAPAEGDPLTDGGGPAATDASTDPQGQTPDEGVDATAPLPPQCAAETAFEATHGPALTPICGACHRAGGLAGQTRLVLPSPGSPGAFAAFQRAHALVGRDAEGTSYLLLKPTGQVGHGGGAVVAEDGPLLLHLEGLVADLEDPAAVVGCGEATPTPPTELEYLDAAETLHKAALQIAGRPPTQAERAAVEADFDALEGVLRGMMAEPAFDQRLYELMNDLLLTDTGRMEQSYGNLAGSSVPEALRALPQCASVNWQNYEERTGTADARTCMEANEAIAVEPLRLAAHVVRSGRPFGEILTARYRYLNVFAARLFGIDLAPFAGHEDDPEFFAEVRIPAMHGPDGLPEEYAGILTTNAFLDRYGSTSTNRNRGRAYHFYKYFRGIDVMQSAVRLDLSQVDQDGNPWRHDPQCIGCHATIDPVAGAFQHWTNCYGIADVRYFAERYCGGPWFPADEMFPPGTGPLPEDTLPAEALPEALGHLADATVARPDFARAIAQHVFSTLTGQPILAVAVEGPERVAFEAQRDTLDALGRDFAAHDLDFQHLVVAVVQTPAFRARSGQGDPAALEGLGGGALVPPELLHRKVEALFGTPWSTEGALIPGRARSLRDPPFPLMSLHRMRILAGGIDSVNLRVRPRVPGALPLAVARRMALEMACRYTAWDLAQPQALRHLLPDVEVDTPLEGPEAAAQIEALHLRFLGERLSAEARAESQALLTALGETARAQGPDLPEACAAVRHFATGEVLPADRQITRDPTGHVRAWQGLLVDLMTDHRFLFEL